jgi:N4-gp56 family major capsid protein
MADKQIYGNDAGTTSSAGSQIRTDYFHKKALVEAAKETYFGQLANTRAMPKNMGKNIKQYHYLPILDDRNQNDQGIDAAGAITAAGTGYTAYISALIAGGVASQTKYFRGDSTTSAAAALVEAKANFNAWALSVGYVCSVITDHAVDAAATYTDIVAVISTDYTIAAIAATGDNPYGNLYGSSKDVGTITSKIPALSESGGRVNRVGMKRIELSATLEKFGFFDEYTQESLDFDSDEELYMHMSQEMVKAANEINEDQIQMDLLNAAGVLRFTGDATSAATLAGAATLGAADVITYDDLVKLGIELDQNRCPKNTKVITGSRMVDTKVVNAARYIYIGSELVPSIMRLTDYHSNKAFIPVAQYASSGNIARGEIGAIDNFRFIVVPEMMFWEGAGADVTDALEETSLFRFGAVTGATGNGASLAYNVYPMLVVGDESFTTVGFQTDGKTVKFKIKNVKPDDNYSSDDPFGETGFTSIKWYY